MVWDSSLKGIDYYVKTVPFQEQKMYFLLEASFGS